MAETAKQILWWSIIDFIIAGILAFIAYNNKNTLALVGFIILGISSISKPIFKAIKG